MDLKDILEANWRQKARSHLKLSHYLKIVKHKILLSKCLFEKFENSDVWMERSKLLKIIHF